MWLMGVEWLFDCLSISIAQNDPSKSIIQNNLFDAKVDVKQSEKWTNSKKI